MRPWNLLELKNIISKWQSVLHGKGWNANYLCNHDQPRSVSRFGDDMQCRKESAKMLATFIHTLEGTPYIYQGEEIGMTNVHFQSIDDYRDVETLNYYEEARKNGISEERVMPAIWRKSRDNARTPMQWDGSSGAGFTTGTPWIRVNSNYREINVASALEDPDSIYHYYRKLIALRKNYKVVVYGKYSLLLPLDTDIYAYTRSLDDQKLLVILNFFSREPEFRLPRGLNGDTAELLISNYDVSPNDDLCSIRLRPYEARVYLLQG
jgi:oligo-1,6-glucosidase